MKSKTKFAFLLMILSLVIFSYPAFSAMKNNNQANLLTGKEIDLLVGTPKDISEPLDSRRNSISKENQVDYSSFLDENALSEENENPFNWEDAEESVPNENQVESQLMDLLAETEELEKTDDIFYYDEDKSQAETLASGTEKLKEEF